MADKITDKTEVKTTELAAILGITARRVQQLTQDGTFVTVKRGKFNLAESVQRYLAFTALRNKAPDDIEKDKLEAEAKLKQHKAEMAELELEEIKGKMHRSEDVAALTEDLIYAMRGMLVSLPGRLSVDVAAVQTPAEASKIIRDEIYKVMNELSEYRYDPKKYEDRVRERLAWSTVERDEEDE